MDDFDRYFTRMQRLAVVAIVVKLAIVGGLIGLAVKAINAFS